MRRRRSAPQRGVPQRGVPQRGVPTSTAGPAFPLSVAIASGAAYHNTRPSEKLERRVAQKQIRFASNDKSVL